MGNQKLPPEPQEESCTPLSMLVLLHHAPHFLTHAPGNANPAAPAARILSNCHGIGEIVPFVDRVFEWGAVTATFLSCASPLCPFDLLPSLKTKLRNITAVLITPSPITLTLYAGRVPPGTATCTTLQCPCCCTPHHVPLPVPLVLHHAPQPPLHAPSAASGSNIHEDVPMAPPTPPPVGPFLTPAGAIAGAGAIPVFMGRLVGHRGAGTASSTARTLRRRVRSIHTVAGGLIAGTAHRRAPRTVPPTGPGRPRPPRCSPSRTARVGGTWAIAVGPQGRPRARGGAS